MVVFNDLLNASCLNCFPSSTVAEVRPQNLTHITVQRRTDASHPLENQSQVRTTKAFNSNKDLVGFIGRGGRPIDYPVPLMETGQNWLAILYEIEAC